MSTRIRVHLRSNAVGYVAIFLFAVGGTAYATHPGGANTISSGDIINGEVRNGDLATDAVASGKIQDRQVKNADLSIGASSSNTIADGGIQNVDVANNTLTGAKVADGSIDTVDLAGNAVNSAKVADNSLSGADVFDGSLTGDDVADGSLTDADTSGLVPYGDVLWAVVNSDGFVVRSSNGTTTVTAEGSGDYEVNFGDGSLDPCASIAQISKSSFADGAPGPGEAASNQGEADPAAIDVRTFDSAGTPTDREFTVHVLCPEGFGGAAAAASADRGRR